MLPLTKSCVTFSSHTSASEHCMANFTSLVTKLNDVLRAIDDNYGNDLGSRDQLIQFLQAGKLLLDEFIQEGKTRRVNELEVSLNGLNILVIQEKQDGKPAVQFSVGDKSELIENMTLDLWFSKFIQELKKPENADMLQCLEIDISTLPENRIFKRLKYRMNFDEIDFTKVCYDFSKETEFTSPIGFEKTTLIGQKIGLVVLMDARFNEALIQNSSFLNSNLSRATFTNACLNKTTFSGCTLDSAKFNGADCTETYWDRVNICGADFTGAVFSGNELFTLNLPDKWYPDTLDAWLNHLTSPESLLTTIDSIDDKYDKLKCNLMRQVVASLQHTNIARIVDSFLDFFNEKEVYFQDITIKSFIKERILPHVIRRAGSSALEISGGQFLTVLLGIVTEENDQAHFMLKNNDFFVQLLAVCLYHANSNIKETAVQLYHVYMNLDELKEYKKTGTCIADLDENSDANIEANLNEIRDIQSDELAFVFFREYGLFTKADYYGTHALIVSKDMMTSMLKQDKEYDWDKVYYIRNQTRTTVINPARAYEHFPLFYNCYQALEKQSQFTKLLEIINLDSFSTDENGNRASRNYAELFRKVLNLKGSDKKLTGYEDQVALASIFNPLLDEEAGISNAHYQQISTTYKLDELNPAGGAQLLFCLAVVFVTYSSSYFFGEEGESPNALRNYAAGLITKAHALDPRVFVDSEGKDQYGDYINKLKGQGDAFTCTAILSSLMKSHAQDKGFYDLMVQIKPLAW